MINLQISSTLANTAQPQTIRLGARVFWGLLAIQAVVLATLAAMMITNAPVGLALSRTDDIEQVRAFILNSDSAQDPLIELAPDTVGRSSAVRGLQYGGQTYFYYFEGRKSYDPMTRGLLHEDQIERVLRDDGGDTPLVIYRILR